MKEKERAEKAIQAIGEAKGEDILLFEMENSSSITAYVLSCTGRSQGHVTGLPGEVRPVMALVAVRAVHAVSRAGGLGRSGLEVP